MAAPSATSNTLTVFPKEYCSGSFDLTEQQFIGHYSRLGSDGRHLVFKDTKIRYCNLDVDERREDPCSHPMKDSDRQLKLSDGFEKYVRREDGGNRIDAVCEWALAISDAEKGISLQEVAMDADVMTDRSTLMKIASTPHVPHRYGWKVDAFRIGKTVVMCPHAIAEEEQFYNSGDGIKNTFRLDKLKYLLSEGGYDPEVPICASNSYHRVMVAKLSDGQRYLKLLYAGQVDCVNRSTDNPVEIRTEFDGDISRSWFKKALRWYIMSRLSGSRQMLLGVRNADDLFTGIEQLPVEWIRKRAEQEKIWRPQTCFTFLHRVLQQIREHLSNKPDGVTVAVSYTPKEKELRFDVQDTLRPERLFVSREFWQKFAGAN